MGTELAVQGDGDGLAALGLDDDALLALFAEAAEATREQLMSEGRLPEHVERDRLGDALVMAVSCGAWKAVDALLALGAGVNDRDRWGQTAMHMAVGAMPSVRELLARGAHAALRDYQFQSTPVGWAHFFEHHQARDHLLEHAALELVDTVLFDRRAAFEEKIAADPDLIDGAPYQTEAWVFHVLRAHNGGAPHPVPEGDRLGEPLRAAAQYGGTDEVVWLLSLGARADHRAIRTGTFERSWLGRTALGWALSGGHQEMAAALRAGGATPSLVDAAANGDEALARSLAGDPGPGELEDALFLAVLGNHPEVARAMLEAGADASRPAPFDQQMRDPLCVGVPHGAEMTKLLLDAGATPTHACLWGKDALHYAGEDAEVRALLEGA